MSLLENKTQRFHSLRVPLANRWSYCKYTIGSKLRNWIGGIWLILFVCSAVSLVLDIFKTKGPDSHVGMLVSVLAGCTETVFYTMSIYFMSIKIKRTRHTLPGALLATLAGMAASMFLVRLL